MQLSRPALTLLLRDPQPKYTPMSLRRLRNEHADARPRPCPVPASSGLHLRLLAEHDGLLLALIIGGRPSQLTSRTSGALHRSARLWQATRPDMCRLAVGGPPQCKSVGVLAADAGHFQGPGYDVFMGSCPAVVLPWSLSRCLGHTG